MQSFGIGMLKGEVAYVAALLHRTLFSYFVTGSDDLAISMKRRLENSMGAALFGV